MACKLAQIVNVIFCLNRVKVSINLFFNLLHQNVAALVHLVVKWQPKLLNCNANFQSGIQWSLYV